MKIELKRWQIIDESLKVTDHKLPRDYNLGTPANLSHLPKQSLVVMLIKWAYKSRKIWAFISIYLTLKGGLFLPIHHQNCPGLFKNYPSMSPVSGKKRFRATFLRFFGSLQAQRQQGPRKRHARIASHLDPNSPLSSPWTSWAVWS